MQTTADLILANDPKLRRCVQLAAQWHEVTPQVFVKVAVKHARAKFVNLPAGDPDAGFTRRAIVAALDKTAEANPDLAHAFGLVRDFYPLADRTED